MPHRLLLTRQEAAEALGMSLSHFQRHVQPYLRCVHSGQLRLFPPVELERWTQEEMSDPVRRRRQAHETENSRHQDAFPERLRTS